MPPPRRPPLPLFPDVKINSPEFLNHGYPKPNGYLNDHPERHFLKIKEVVFNDKSPKIIFTDDGVAQQEYTNIKQQINPEPGIIDLGPHFANHDLTSYLAHAKPGQVLNIKIVEPIEKSYADASTHHVKPQEVEAHKEYPREENKEQEKEEQKEEQAEVEPYVPPVFTGYDDFFKPDEYFGTYREQPKKLDTKDEKLENLRQPEDEYEDGTENRPKQIVYNNIKENFEVENLHDAVAREKESASVQDARNEPKPSDEEAHLKDFDQRYKDYVKDIDKFISAHFDSNVEKYKIPSTFNYKYDDKENPDEKESEVKEESKHRHKNIKRRRPAEKEEEQKTEEEEKKQEESKVNEQHKKVNEEIKKEEQIKGETEPERIEDKGEEETQTNEEIFDGEERFKLLQDENEKEFDDIFNNYNGASEFDDFYSQFHKDPKFEPSKQNLIENPQAVKGAPPKENQNEKQESEQTVVQPLYSGTLFSGTLLELDKIDKPGTVPFDHEYSASEKKGKVNKREVFDYDDDEEERDEDPEEENHKLFTEESKYVPDTYSPEITFKVPEPKIPDYAKMESRSDKPFGEVSDDRLSPKAYVTKREDGMKTTWIKIKIPVTTLT